MSVYDVVQRVERVLNDPGVSKQQVEHESLLHDIRSRIRYIDESIIKTAEDSPSEVEKAVDLLRKWMVQQAIVRVVGAGRARLAGSLPANRLTHGGAKVFIIDDIIPMPHSIKGGGIIVVSASGTTPSVLEFLAAIRGKGSRVKILGLASYRAEELRRQCDVFIGVRTVEGRNPIQALADTEEYVISMLLDAMVVAAGKRAGFDDTRWRLGHENLGPTGDYDASFRSR